MSVQRAAQQALVRYKRKDGEFWNENKRLLSGETARKFAEEWAGYELAECLRMHIVNSWSKNVVDKNLP